MMDADTKQYLEVLFTGLQRDISGFKDDLARLSGEILKQGAAIHSIEITVTQKFTELRADLNVAFAKIREMEEEAEKEEAARVASDISLGRRFTEFETAQAEKWKVYVEAQKVQAIENDRNQGTRKTLYWIGGILGAEVILLIWQMILNGGLQGIVK